MGNAPTWYRAIKAAQYLGVAPWEIVGQPLAWVRMAEEAQTAEARAEAMREKRNTGR